jgi:hypothetical protein
MKFDLYVDDMYRNYRQTPASGLCHTIAAYQIHREASGFTHTPKHHQGIIDYMNEIKDEIVKYFDLDKDFGITRLIEEFEENIALLKQNKKSKYQWGELDNLMFLIRDLYGKGIANSKAITLSGKAYENISIFGDAVGNSSIKNQLNEDFRVTHDSRFGCLVTGLTHMC